MVGGGKISRGRDWGLQRAAIVVLSIAFALSHFRPGRCWQHLWHKIATTGSQSEARVSQQKCKVAVCWHRSNPRLRFSNRALPSFNHCFSFFWDCAEHIVALFHCVRIKLRIPPSTPFPRNTCSPPALPNVDHEPTNLRLRSSTYDLERRVRSCAHIHDLYQAVDAKHLRSSSIVGVAVTATKGRRVRKSVAAPSHSNTNSLP